VWTNTGLVCAAATFKGHVKLNFFKGAALADPMSLFNAGLEAKAMRAIDFSQGNKIQEAALQDLIRAAVAYNQSRSKKEN
jgi:hypothetical protein